ncbi:MAG: TetR/AcrR family transcriptional regulator, partial [Acetobacteraceae bacterium]|nr:TetR/AcrR family transcriptional regulator [Acetobacteraceae bacterium]
RRRCTVAASRRREIGQERRERTRARLVEAALRLFARKGPDAPSIDELVAEAGVARGSFYNCFETRDELLTAVAIRAADAIQAGHVGFRTLPDPADRIARAVRGFIRTAHRDPVLGWAVVRMAAVAAPLGETMRANLSHDLEQGMATGRFSIPSVAAGRDIVLGGGMMGMRSVLQGEAGPGHAEVIAELVLRALGVTDAAAVVARPLDPAAPVPADGRGEGLSVTAARLSSGHPDAP